MKHHRIIQEWPFWLVLLACYSIWLVSLFVLHQDLPVLALLLACLASALHSSLQHESVHGHPSAQRWFNELLVFPPLGLLYPYRRYRVFHLRHHIDARLTDPIEDPESWYLSAQAFARADALTRAVLLFNNTLLGRLTIGPLIVMAGLLRSESRLILQGDKDVLIAWLFHLSGVALVLLCVNQAGVSLLQYFFLVAWPAMSLLLLRSFIEHRATEQVAGRTAVIEAGWLMSLLFLNNNLHSVHHRYPSLAWHRLPQRWREEKQQTLVANQHYHYAGGYWQVCKQWLTKVREPLRHPFMRSESSDTSIE